ncbi:MAG: response regulator [Proteobacteria bacterium]|nr:response regulator [Pseudomonadota bacterium]MDA0926673.1 response regulator [Pseudomonadota bacterium]
MAEEKLSQSVAREHAYRREQVRMLYRQLPLMYLSDVVAGGFLFFVLLEDFSQYSAIIWFAVITVTTAGRALVARNHTTHRVADADMPMRWRFLVWGSTFAGFMWGSAWLLLPQNPEVFDVLILGVWMAGIQAGTSATMVIIRQAYLGFTIPQSVLFLGYLVFSPVEGTLLLAAAYVMYMAFIVPIALRSGSGFARLLDLQISNAELRESLQTEEMRLRQSTEELIREKEQYQLLQQEKVAADEKLKSAAEERLLLLDTVGEGIFGLDARGNITFINSSALRMLKLDEDTTIGRSALQLISSTGAASAANVEAFVAINRCLQNSRPIESMECQMLGRDGFEIPVRFSCAPIIKDGGVKGAVVSFINVAKQKEMEAMLLQSQKMEAIGRLTGGVAHDFNNLLTVIMGNLQFLKRHMPEDERLQGFVDKTIQAARSGAELNNRLLGFSREQEIETELVEIDSVIHDMEYFLDRLLGENVQLKVELGAESLAAYTNRTQLENAILNLGVNAKDAMPDGGVLEIVTSRQRMRNSFVRQDDSLGEADYIEIRVTDFGCGIDPEIQERIFEPFFTTKDKDKGTGLGLATVYGFMRQTGGNITVNSRKGEWTTFKLYFPMAKGAIAAVPKIEKVERYPTLKNYTGKVLVVEDDKNVREVAVHTLKDAGYEVLSVADGEEALKSIADNPDLQMIFSDIIMPAGISGIELAERVVKTRPQLPILLATAYTEKSLKEKLVALKNVSFVAKPYDTEDLPGLIHSMLVKAAS